MQVPGCAEKNMYYKYFDYKILGCSLTELDCSQEAMLKIQMFELHQNKSVTQIVAASEGLLSEYETSELMQILKITRRALKTFDKSSTMSEISAATIYHHPSLYQISYPKRKGQQAPFLWVCGWLLANMSQYSIRQHGGVSYIVLLQAKEIIAILKKRNIEAQDVEKVNLSLNSGEIKEINRLRTLFKLKVVEKNNTKRISHKETKAVCI